LTAGALESAERLLGELLAVPAAFANADAATLAPILETLLMIGERRHARQLAEANTGRLLGTARGLALLELTGLDAGKDFLPDGRPHLLRWQRRLESGELLAADLAHMLEARASSWLRSPELHLLFFNALLGNDSERARRFLNRFLSLYGPNHCVGLAAPTANLLGSLRFAAPPRARRSVGLVSVLVAAHNAGTTIGYAIDSLLRQTYEELEILVGDDASEDDTLAILAMRFRDEPRVRVFRSVRNQGAYNVRNALARRARGKLITFHDADDFALPDRIERQVVQMQRSSVGACVANFVRVRPNGSIVFFRDQRATRLCRISLMLWARTFDSVGPFRSARVGADLELYAKLCAHLGPNGVKRIRVPLLFGLSASGSATQAPGTEALEDGYRSPARRAYSELVFAQHQRDQPSPTDAEIDARLRATDNMADTAELLDC
jgi:hypothetical protein